MSHDSPDDQTPGSQKPRPVKVLRFVVLLVLVAAIVAVSGITSRRKSDEKLAHWTKERAIPTVAIVHPKRDDEIRTIRLPGDVEAFYSASLHGQVSGYVQDWKLDIGAKVKRGQTLATIDTPEVDERITRAQGELAKAKAQQALAHVTADRWRTLSGSSAVSQQAIDEKEANAVASDAQVDAARADLQKLHALKGFANIVAPFDGVITARNIDIGSLVAANASNKPPLFVVADVHEMRIYVRAPEVFAAVMRQGMKAKLSLPEYPTRTFPAVIATTSEAIDKKSRALLVELHADNKEGMLKPGAFAEVSFELPPNPKALILPASALVFHDLFTYVATVDNHSRIRLKKIRITRDYGSRVEIEGGLSPEDRIVRNPLQSMAEGDLVRISEGTAEKTSDDTKPGDPKSGDTKSGSKLADEDGTK
jgi:RND family efflux transporter MFP subunit